MDRHSLYRSTVTIINLCVIIRTFFHLFVMLYAYTILLGIFSMNGKFPLIVNHVKIL